MLLYILLYRITRSKFIGAVAFNTSLAVLFSFESLHIIDKHAVSLIKKECNHLSENLILTGCESVSEFIHALRIPRNGHEWEKYVPVYPLAQDLLTAYLITFSVTDGESTLSSNSSNNSGS